MPDFLLYGGLSGRVWLHGIPALHMDEASVRIKTRAVLSDYPTAHLYFVVQNQSSGLKNFYARWRLLSQKGEEIALCETRARSIQAGQRQALSLSIPIADPQRWRLESPYLYTLKGELIGDDNVIDALTARFGLREADFNDHGFHLNGERVYLKGVNRHEYMPGLGNALPERLHREDVELLKALGFNFVRCSHYPQHPAFWDACDELGILVYAEVATWKSVRRGRWLKAACRQMRAMVQRDRHHPSIIMGHGQ